MGGGVWTYAEMEKGWHWLRTCTCEGILSPAKDQCVSLTPRILALPITVPGHPQRSDSYPRHLCLMNISAELTHVEGYKVFLCLCT